MSVSPILTVEGKAEAGDVDPSKMSHEQIIELARHYREAVKVAFELRRLLDDANVVILKLQDQLKEYRRQDAAEDLD